MKVVQLLRKTWPETAVLFSSMAYLIIRIVTDVNKIHLPTWFEYFDMPTISSFLMTFILLYRNIISEQFISGHSFFNGYFKQAELLFCFLHLNDSLCFLKCVLGAKMVYLGIFPCFHPYLVKIILQIFKEIVRKRRRRRI